MRHVADALPHRFGIHAHVQPLHISRPTAKRQKSREHFDDSGLAAPVGAEKAENFAFLDAEAHVVHGGKFAETPDKMFCGDGSLSGILRSNGHELISRFQFYVRGHSRQNVSGWIIDADFYAENLVNALFACLHVAWKKLCLLIDLFDDAIKNRLRKRIDPHFRLLPDLHVAELSFRNVDANINLILFKQRSDRRVRRDDVTWTDVEHLNGRRRGRGHLALAEARFVVGVGRFRKINILAAIAAFKFFESGLRLAIVRFRGRNFLWPVSALQHIELVLVILLLRQRHLPVGLGRVALLFRNEILLRQRFVTLKIEPRANFVRGSPLDVGLRCGDIFLSVPVQAQFIVGFGLRGSRTRLRRFPRADSRALLSRLRRETDREKPAIPCRQM